MFNKLVDRFLDYNERKELELIEKQEAKKNAKRQPKHRASK